MYTRTLTVDASVGMIKVGWNLIEGSSYRQVSEESTGVKMGLDQDFEKAAEDIKSLTKRPTDQELLELYALFKQATVGDVSGDKPGMFDLKGKAKYGEWSKKKGISKEDAKKAYVEYANTLVQKYK